MVDLENESFRPTINHFVVYWILTKNRNKKQNLLSKGGDCEACERKIEDAAKFPVQFLLSLNSSRTKTVFTEFKPRSPNLTTPSPPPPNLPPIAPPPRHTSPPHPFTVVLKTTLEDNSDSETHST